MSEQRKLTKEEFVARVLAEQQARRKRAAIIRIEYTMESITRSMRRKQKHRRR